MLANGKLARAMNEINGEARRVTSVELLDAAIWREINSDDPQPPEAFLQYPSDEPI
jgi:hypothetical protein